MSLRCRNIFFVHLSLLAFFVAPALAEVRLGDPAVALGNPAVAVGDDGLLRVAWSESVAGINQILWASYTDAGTRVRGPVQVTNDANGCSTPRIDLDGQNQSYLVWRSGVSGGRTYFARLSDDGVTQAGPVMVYTRGGQYSVPDLATDPVTQRTHIASRLVAVSLFYIEYALVDLNGIVLAHNTPADYDITLYPDKTPAVELDPSGLALVVYQDNAGSFWPTPGFYEAIYSSSGTRLARTKLATTESAYPLDVVCPRVGEPWIFYQKSSGTPHIYRLDGSSSVLASPLPGPSRSPRCAAAEGHGLFVVWEEASAPRARVLAQQWSLDGDCLIDTLAVSHSDADATQPDIATDGNGRYFVVWRDMRDGNPAIYLGKLPPFGLDVQVRSASTGNPVAEALVTILSAEDVIDEKTSGPDGIARFRDHDATEVVARAEFQGHAKDAWVRFPYPHDRVDSVSVEVPTDFEVYGRILDKHNRQGVPGYLVELLDNQGDPVVEVNSRRDGRFFLYTAAAGTFRVRMTKQAVVGTAGKQPIYPDTTSAAFTLGVADSLMDMGTYDLPSKLVVMVHGIKASSAMWRDSGFADLLRSRGWTVLDNLDLPGRILVTDLYGMASVVSQARTLQRVVEAFDAPNYQIVAHSQGGLVSRFMIERLEAGRPAHVERLITLATPHHGSPLATSIAGILRGLDLTLSPDLGLFQSPTLLNMVEEAYPAFVDLKPNSKFLRLLNQGDEEMNDWAGTCLSLPNHENGLRPETAYLTVAGREHPGWYEASHALLLDSDCWSTDGVVPELSARLQETSGSNVWNILWQNVHHKAAVHIYADPTLQAHVADLLETPPAAWPPSTTAPATKAGESGTWNLASLVDLVVPVSGPGTATTRVDPSDTLSFNWHWSAGDVDLRLVSPSSVVIDSAYAASSPEVEYERYPEQQGGSYVLVSPEPGLWTLEGRATGATVEQNVVVWQMSEGAIQVDLELEPETTAPFARRRARVNLRDAAAQPVLGATVNAEVSLAGGAVATVPLTDDGLAGDEMPADGVYGAWIDLDQTPGTSTVEVTATGTVPAAFSRRVLAAVQTGEVTDIRIEAPGLVGTSRTGQLGSRIGFSANILNAGLLDAEVEIALWRDDENLRLQTDTLTIAAGAIVPFESSYLPLQEGSPDFRLLVSPLNIGDADWSSNFAMYEAVISPPVSGVPDPGTPDDPFLPGPLQQSLNILQAFPNPFNPSIQVEFNLPRAGTAELEVYDLGGRRILRRQTGPLGQGAQTLRWDGQDDGGRAVPSGVYFVCVRTGADFASRKVALVR
jgi:hypothetical protein